MMDNLKLFVIYGIGLLTFSSCMVKEVFGDEAEVVVEDEIVIVHEEDIATAGAIYRGLPSHVESKIFNHVERYDTEALYSIIFGDRDYLVISWHNSTTISDQPVAGYSFVLFDEKVSFTGPTRYAQADGNNYTIGLGDGEFSAGEDIVDRSINFIVEEDGSISYLDTTSNFVKDGSYGDPGVIWSVLPSTYQKAHMVIYGSSTTINYASYATNFDDQLVNRHWLKIKDYSIRVGRLTDYEKILLVGIVVVGYAFVRFFKFRS